MKRIRNPRYAPEFLERKLSPSTLATDAVAPADYSTTDAVLDPATAPDPSSPYPSDPYPADPGTPDDGNGDPPTDPIPVPTPGPVGPAVA
jgi:hypothetical protein